MTNTPALKVAGIAGGVGTTVLATIIGGEDLGLFGVHDDYDGYSDADIIVARNDFRSAKALVDALEYISPEALVALVVEPDRALSIRDFEDATGRSVFVIERTAAVARADDAGLLEYGSAQTRRIKNAVLQACQALQNVSEGGKV